MKNTIAAMLMMVMITSTHAADIRFSDHMLLLLTGTIQSGDAERLAEILSTEHAVRLELDTLGGNVTEALRIAQLVKGAKLSTRPSAGGVCASACFFIYMAGNFKSAHGAGKGGKVLPDEFLKGRFVGIHRPYIDFAKNSFKEGENQNEKIIKIMIKFLQEEMVPQYLIDIMMSRPSNDVYWLTHDDLDMLGEYGPDKEEFLVRNCGYKRPRQQYEERWSEDRVGAVLKCEVEFYRRHELPDVVNFREKLKTGWRPWE